MNVKLRKKNKQILIWSVLACLTTSLCFICIGCLGGGGGGGGTTESISTSFFPAYGTSASGKEVAVEHTYALNGGNPIAINNFDVDGDDYDINMAVSDVTVKSAPKNDGFERSYTISGNISGDITGVFSASGSQLLAENEVTKNMDITGEHMLLSLKGRDEYGSGAIALDMNSSFDPPINFFIARDNLNTKPIGYGENYSTTATLTGKLTATDAGVQAIDKAVNMSGSWEITNKWGSFQISGQTYYDVVQVEWTTKVPALDGTLKDTTITYWLAKGIGMIKSYGEFNILGQSVTAELAKTNLVLNFDSVKDTDTTDTTNTTITGNWPAYAGSWSSNSTIASGYSTSKFFLDVDVQKNGTFSGDYGHYFRGSCQWYGDMGICAAFFYSRIGNWPVKGNFNFDDDTGTITFDNDETHTFAITSKSDDKIIIELDNPLTYSVDGKDYKYDEAIIYK